jgi:hypothetical protein
MQRLIYFYHDGNESDLRWAWEIMTRQVCDEGLVVGADASDEGRYHYEVKVIGPKENTP